MTRTAGFGRGSGSPAVVHGLIGAVVAVAIFGADVFGGGYFLRGDMVFVPDMPWKTAWLGFDGAVPRAAPMDAFVWACTTLLPGWLVQRILLLGPVLLGAVGLGRLLESHGLLARAAAIAVLWWNPWVAERLAIGQWTIVAGLALLPWTALAASRFRSVGDWSGVAVVSLAAGFCGPPTALTNLVLLVVLLWRRSRARECVLAACLAVVGMLPWLGPSLALSYDQLGGGLPFSAFAPRAESAAGLVTSVVSLGGIWKESIWLPERTDPVVVVASAVLVLACLWAVRRATLPHRWSMRLAGLGVASLVAVTAMGLDPVADWADGVAVQWPPVSVLRDSHRFLGVAVLAGAVGMAELVTWILRAARPGREALRMAALLLALTPLMLLPGLALGLGGDLQAVHYPDEWSHVRAELESGVAAGTSTVVVLPWHGSYRGYAWNGKRAMLDPAPRFLPGDVLIDDRVFLNDNDTIPSEDPRLVEVTVAVETGSVSALEELGVGWVLTEKDNGAVAIVGGEVVHDGEGLRLQRLSPVGSDERGTPGWAMSVAWGPWVLVLFSTLVRLFARTYAKPSRHV